MLGFYEGFPRNVQIISHFTSSISDKSLQRALLQICHELNTKTLRLEDVGSPSIPQCSVNLEFGIANGDSFSFLGNEETNKSLRAVNTQPLQIMDLLCLIRYYKTTQKGKTPLRFDHYMLRFVFDKNSANIQVFHERGPTHVLPDEIATFMTCKINEHFSKKILKLTNVS